ncbi:hypothetical protein [Paractinoplanes maris]|uniref:hypothetical protein n=1 Tax=Paractinoplanes maris TaxID=1734446 RepID=UPI0020218608|nr:hypothetical protein [Actinoplanes maris]
MSVALAIFAAVVAALLGWAVNQLPPLKDHVSVGLRLWLVVGLVAISVVATVTVTRLNDDQEVTGRSEAQPDPAVTSIPGSTLGPANTSIPSPTSAPTSALLRSGSVILNARQVMNLDAPARDLRWGIDDDCACPGTKQDLKWSSSAGFEPPTWVNDTFLLLLDGPVDGPQVCPALTGYSKDPIGPDELDRGSSLCVQTAEKNFALVNVTQIDKGNKAIHFDARVIAGS